MNTVIHEVNVESKILKKTNCLFFKYFFNKNQYIIKSVKKHLEKNIICLFLYQKHNF